MTEEKELPSISVYDPWKPVTRPDGSDIGGTISVEAIDPRAVKKARQDEQAMRRMEQQLQAADEFNNMWSLIGNKLFK
jgi:hypothetical protein